MQNQEEIHLRDYLKIIRKRRGVILIFFTLTFLSILIFTFASTPLYEATSEVLIEKGEATKLTGRAMWSRYDPEFSATQIQLIKSFNVAKRVVDSLHLATEYKDYFFKDSFVRKQIKELLLPIKTTISGLLPGSPSVDAGSGVVDTKSKALEANRRVMTGSDMIATTIMNGITIKPVLESRVVQISFLHQNPIIAQMIANEVAKAYKDEVLEIGMSNSAYTIKWMSEKALEERERLEESEGKLQAYMKDANILTLEDKVAILPDKLKELSSKLSTALAKKDELDNLNKKLSTIGDNYDEAESISEITASRYYQDILSKMLKAEQNKKELAKKYGQKHPKMIQALEEIVIFDREKRSEIKKQILTIKNKADLSRKEVENLEKMVEATKREAQKFNKDFFQYSILKRDVATNRTMYEALLSQVKEKKVAEQSSTVNVWITKAAMTPGSPKKPNKRRNLLLGIILGLFGGVGLAFFIEYLDNTIRSPEEIEQRTGVSVLSIIEQLDPEMSDGTSDLLAADDGFSSFAESIKAIRTSILLSSADNPPKRLLVTSSVPGEGKTTTTVNLAKAFALAGYKTVLLDADLRKPRIHKIFDINNSKGLSTYLAGIEEEGFIQAVGVEKLSVIPAGPMPPNPSELLVSDRFKSLLSTLEMKFDYIFIDSAPLFSATETLFLSKMAKSILVVRAGETTFDHVLEAVKMLNNAETPPLGIVLNGLDKKSSHYGYGAHKYYGYYTAKS